MPDPKKMNLVRTPIPYLQLLTAGGIRFSTLIELWGPNRAGKSTVCYQTGGYFLEDYGDKAQLKILDSETSVDNVRMKESFNIDVDFDPRVEVQPAHFIEDGFFKILNWVRAMDNSNFMMIIWDTISASPTKSSYDAAIKASEGKDANMFTGGMADRPRVIKHYLRQIMSEIYGKNITLWIPNQIFSSMNSYGAAEVRGEGTALQHDIHYSLKFKRLKVEYDSGEAETLANNTISQVSLVKSKFCPEFEKCPIFMDNTQGGRIIESQSVFLLARDVGIIFDSSGKGHWKYDQEMSGMRWKKLIQDPEAYEKVLGILVNKIRRQYTVVNRLYEMNGYAPLSTDTSKKAEPATPYLECNLNLAFRNVDKCAQILADNDLSKSSVDKGEGPSTTKKSTVSVSQVAGAEEKVDDGVSLSVKSA